MLTRIVQIETATEICSVALTQNGEDLAFRESQIKNSHSNLITTFIAEILKEASVQLSDIDAIAVSGGPGSYTGIRIGMAVAKGMCFALNIPLIKICTLQALAWAAKQELEQNKINAVEGINEINYKTDSLFVPLIDARRMEVFTSVYDNGDLKELEPPKAKIIDEAFFNSFNPQSNLVFVGNGSEKCYKFAQEQMNINKEHQFLSHISCSAKWLNALAYQAFLQKDFVDLQLTTADYYKDFYTHSKQ